MIKKLSLFVLILLLFFLFYIKSIFDSSNHLEFTKHKFIAHAGGAINDITYSNSEEAVNNSIKLGYKLIELDLLETSDGFIVAAHDWKNFKKNCLGFSGPIDEKPLSFREFNDCNFSINSMNLTQLDEKKITDIFNQNPDLYLVTDKLNNYSLLYKKFNFRDRIIPETFSINDFISAKLNNFDNALYPFKKFNIFLKYFLNIKIVTISYEDFIKNEKKITNLFEKGLKIYLYTSNENFFIQKYLDKSISGIYTDFWDLNLKKCISSFKCKSY